MKVRCLLIGVVVLFVAGVLTVPGYAKIDTKAIVGIWNTKTCLPCSAQAGRAKNDNRP